MIDEKSAEQPDSSELPKGKNEPTDKQASAPEPDEVKKLQDSFDRVYNGPNKLRHEYDLRFEAKQVGMEIEEYRRWYELSSKPPTWRSRFWRWTGIAEKKGWDLMTGISIPLFVFLGGGLFTYFNNQQQQNIADEKQKDEVLKNYFDNIKSLILDEKHPLQKSKKYDERRSIARTLTLTTLSQLTKDNQEIKHGNNQRKGFVIQFLWESGLTKGPTPIVSLRKADLTGADLTGADFLLADLNGADLSGANLSGANLSEADFLLADLNGADLGATNLRGANLENADLTKAFLSRADLSGAIYDVKTKWPHGFNFKQSGAKLCNMVSNRDCDTPEEAK
jgi:Pentapeptide repeats (8 copies)